MAFTNAEWGTLAATDALRLFAYSVPVGDDVTAAGYFNDVWNEVQISDLIYARSASGVTIYRVSAIAPRSVTIAAV